MDLGPWIRGARLGGRILIGIILWCLVCGGFAQEMSKMVVSLLLKTPKMNKICCQIPTFLKQSKDGPYGLVTKYYGIEAVVIEFVLVKTLPTCLGSCFNGCHFIAVGQHGIDSIFGEVQAIQPKNQSIEHH